jgi:hypothetical protein
MPANVHFLQPKIMFWSFPQTQFQAIMTQRDRDMEMMKERGGRYSVEIHGLNPATIAVIESVIRVFDNLLNNEGKFRDDFRVAVIRSSEKRREYETKGRFITVMNYALSVWCLNPAIAFAVRILNIF